MLTLLMLAGCFDAAETQLVLNVKTGESHVVQRMHNAWPTTVGCAEKEGVLPTTVECVAEVKEYLDSQVATIKNNGGTVARAGIVLVEGKLDFLYDYTAPAGGKTLTDQGLSVYWAFTRSPADVKASRPGKKQLALLVSPQDRGTSKIDVLGKYSLLQGDIADETLRVYTFAGSTATVNAAWTNVPDPAEPGPGAWLKPREGLESALAASGMVVVP